MDARQLTPEQAERLKLYQQADKILLDQAYYIPMTYSTYYCVVKPWVKNFAINNDHSLYTLPSMYVAKH